MVAMKHCGEGQSDDRTSFWQGGEITTEASGSIDGILTNGSFFGSTAGDFLDAVLPLAHLVYT